MATNPEAVSKLLAISTLMNGERDLLRRRDGATTAQAPSASPETAAPIATGNKAIATVLLTLLDEQLHATETAAAGQLQRPNAAESDASASKLVAAKYATDGFVRGDGLNLPEPMFASDQARMRDMSSVVSADLQTFVQRSAAFAAGNSRASYENSDETRDSARPVSAIPGWASPFGIASLAILLLTLLAIAV